MRQFYDHRLLFFIPALFLYTLFAVFPLFKGVGLSLTEFTGVGEATWTGLNNYKTIFSEQSYIKVLTNTLIYAIFVVIFQNGIGLILAAFLHEFAAIRNLLRVALLVPSMLSLVIAGYIWQYIYSPIGGGLNELLGFFGFTNLPVWLGNEKIALFSVATVHVWMFVGYSTAIFLAGYAGISPELKDAARMDAVPPIKRFWHIDLPLLAPAMTVNITLSTIGTLKSFEFPYVMTLGGPDNATMNLGLKVFLLIFKEYQFGMAAALSVLMIVIVAMIALLQNAYLRSREDRL